MITRIRCVTAAIAAAGLSLLVGAAPAAASVATETADVIGQGPAGPVVSTDGATIQRNQSGISIQLTMPTPEPGSYDYPPANAFHPEGARPGHPEAFSLWVFVFNHPDECSDPCDGNDLGDTPGARWRVQRRRTHRGRQNAPARRTRHHQQHAVHRQPAEGAGNGRSAPRRGPARRTAAGTHARPDLQTDRLATILVASELPRLSHVADRWRIACPFKAVFGT